MKVISSIPYFKKAMSMILIIAFFGISVAQGIQEPSQSDNPIETISESLSLSNPYIQQIKNKTHCYLSEANSFTMIPGVFKIPTIQKVYEFPLGTHIINISITDQQKQSISISNPLIRNPAFQEINGKNTLSYPEKSVSLDQYPDTSHVYHTGIGLNKENQRVLFLSLTLFPIHYISSENKLTHSGDIDIEILYSRSSQICNNDFNDDKDLLIITHPSYEHESLLPFFIQHKQAHGFTVHVQTTDDIYGTYPGRDNAEKIKYCIKNEIEKWSTSYVLILGDIKQVPMRETDAYPWSPYHGKGILTDLYYADIYDTSMNFCSWDQNQNNVFSEVITDGFPPVSEENLDGVDLYADVHIGRIPSSNPDELNIVLNKIMVYETQTYDQTWFQNILLAGGDTFGLSKGSPPFVFEGEITNTKVGQQVPEFNQIRLWASHRNLHPWTFNKEISKGVGFVSYAGHGFEHGWGTYHPNAILDGNLIFYFTPYLRFLSNEHKLPIIFFDACLTAKLDFNISDLIDYFGLKARLINMILGGYGPSDYFDVFAWAILKMEGGGCVANVGATRPAYTYVDKDGVYAGAGYLDVHFFKAYEEGVTVGEMLTSAQRDYANYVGKDFFTIQEYILLGDPSLRVGGYP